MDDDELALLLSLDGASYEMASGVIVEFTVRRTTATPQRPHGISYALVLRPKAGAPWIRFDNAHGIEQSRRKKRVAYDHWHRTTGDRGRPYEFSTVLNLLDDFWREVRRALDEKNIAHDL
ncbi:MAG TPA: DUF6516 family protein [Stellaceae bacterium]|jgi:hypothetical protein|nr:DUF6516 family protein [Stellaceae bacterium]